MGSYNAPPDLPYDQREEDGGSLVFDSDALTERMEILGAPVVHLELSADQPVAMVAARLSDVAPDGTATRVTYGLLNLTHRDGHDRTPNRWPPASATGSPSTLNGVAQAFPPGHRLRLSLSTSYWPLAWPPPRAGPADRLRGPQRADAAAAPDPGRRRADRARPSASRRGAAAGDHAADPGQHRWTVTRDLVDYESALEIVKDLGMIRFDDIGLDVTRRAYERYSWVADDFTSVRGESTWSMGFTRGDWEVRTETRTVLTSTATTFKLHARLDAYEGAERVFEHSWRLTIPRDHV